MSTPFAPGIPLPFGDPGTIAAGTTAKLVDVGSDGNLDGRRRVVLYNTSTSVVATLTTDLAKTKPFMEIPPQQAITVIASAGESFYISAASSINVYCYEVKV